METIFKGYTVQTFTRTLDANGNPESEWVCTNRYPSASGQGHPNPYVYSSKGVLKGTYKLKDAIKEGEDTYLRRSAIRDSTLSPYKLRLNYLDDPEEYKKAQDEYLKSCVGYNETKYVIRKAHIVLQ